MFEYFMWVLSESYYKVSFQRVKLFFFMYKVTKQYILVSKVQSIFIGYRYLATVYFTWDTDNTPLS